MTYYKEHAKVWVSVDVIIFGFDEGKLKILIGRRQMDPGRGEWSLYGGFVDGHESIDDAAARVLQELTGMRNVYMRQVGAYGAVDRDPGERVISIAYYALINVRDYDEHLRREHSVEWVDINKIPELYSDHNQMVSDALKKMRQKIRVEPISFRLLPPLFTLTQLQLLYEAIWDEPYFYSSNNTVMVHIRKLRKKIEDDPQKPKYIRTEWGRGYKFVSQE